MAQTKRQIESILERAGMHPRHRFGQNFMIDANLVRLIADAGEIDAGDLVVEVGPGTGTLTEELLERAGPAGKILAMEIDRELAAGLRDRFQADPRFSLIEGDALAGKHALNVDLAEAIEVARGEGRGVRLVANLPYNIASPLIVELLLAGVDVLAFTVQREVADRLRAGPAQGKEYGPLSVIVQTLSDVELLRTIPAEAFWPRPKIESALVRLHRREIEPGLRGRERDFGRFVTGLFTMRRKTLRKALAGVMRAAPRRSTASPAGEAVATKRETSRPLASAGLSGDERPDQVDAAGMRRLYLALDLPWPDPAAPGSMMES